MKHLVHYYYRHVGNYRTGTVDRSQRTYRGLMTLLIGSIRWWCRKTPCVCVCMCVCVGGGDVPHLINHLRGQAYVNLDVHPYLGITAGQIPPRGSADNQYPRGPNKATSINYSKHNTNMYAKQSTCMTVNHATQYIKGGGNN